MRKATIARILESFFLVTGICVWLMLVARLIFPLSFFHLWHGVLVALAVGGGAHVALRLLKKLREGGPDA